MNYKTHDSNEETNYVVKEQLSLLYVPSTVKRSKDTSSTFLDNLSLPLHRWFRYSAGFSAMWVNELIKREKANGRHRIFDPFSGSGTVLLEGEFCNVEAMGIEAHPFVARICRAKLVWRENPSAFLRYATAILNEAKSHKGDIDNYPPIIHKCFAPEILAHLDSLKKAWLSKAGGSPLSELTWLCLASIIRMCSHAGTAQWQYVLPKKTKSKVTAPYEAFKGKMLQMYEDMTFSQMKGTDKHAVLHQEDSRECSSVPDSWADLVITSPPYANNYDYADATRLEMSFFGEIEGWGDLQDTVRKYLIRSCTQHAAGLKKDVTKIINDSVLAPIRTELLDIYNLLEEEKEKHGGKKPYNIMIAAYFNDLAKVWLALRRITAKDSLVCFVVGDSAPYGIYVPVDKWLGELAVAAGFKSYRFEKTRDRNVKWENRKHRVPLHEGRLWVEG